VYAPIKPIRLAVLLSAAILLLLLLVPGKADAAYVQSAPCASPDGSRVGHVEWHVQARYVRWIRIKARGGGDRDQTIQMAYRWRAVRGDGSQGFPDDTALLWPVDYWFDVRNDGRWHTYRNHEGFEFFPTPWGWHRVQITDDDSVRVYYQPGASFEWGDSENERCFAMSQPPHPPEHLPGLPTWF
jgi:hypothetical protein